MVWLPYDAGLSVAVETLVGILKRVIVSPAIYPRFLEIAELARSLCHSWATCCNSAPVGERCTVISLSVCLSVCKHISGTAGLIFTKFFVHISSGFGSVLLWQRCNTLCTSSFVDDVTFGRSGPYGDVCLAALRYWGGVWCLWMPC